MTSLAWCGSVLCECVDSYTVTTFVCGCVCVRSCVRASLCMCVCVCVCRYIYMNICKDNMMICLQAHWRAAQAHTNSARQSPTSPKTQKASPTPPAQGTAMRRRDASHKHKHVASRNPDPKSTDEEHTMLVASMTEQEEAVCRRLGDGGAGGRVLAIAREVARMHLRVGDGARFRVLSARLGALQVHARVHAITVLVHAQTSIDANLHTHAHTELHRTRTCSCANAWATRSTRGAPHKHSSTTVDG